MEYPKRRRFGYESYENAPVQLKKKSKKGPKTHLRHCPSLAKPISIAVRHSQNPISIADLQLLASHIT
jgi:hypothetical protein